MSIGAVFDEDYESAIIFAENTYNKNEIVKYECILAFNSRYFNNFIRNNCSNYTHKCSFSRRLLWYKIHCVCNLQHPALIVLSVQEAKL
jgi:hypothetical protein